MIFTNILFVEQVFWLSENIAFLLCFYNFLMIKYCHAFATDCVFLWKLYFNYFQIFYTIIWLNLTVAKKFVYN